MLHVKYYMYIVHVDSKCLAYMYGGGVTLTQLYYLRFAAALPL